MSIANAISVQPRFLLLNNDTHTPLSVRLLAVALVLLLGILVYRLIFGDGSVQEVWNLHQKSAQQKAQIKVLQLRNNALEAEVLDLKKGLEAIEERARSDLGMIRRGETYYQFIDQDQRVNVDQPKFNDTLTPEQKQPKQ